MSLRNSTEGLFLGRDDSCAARGDRGPAYQPSDAQDREPDSLGHKRGFWAHGRGFCQGRRRACRVRVRARRRTRDHRGVSDRLVHGRVSQEPTRRIVSRIQCAAKGRLRHTALQSATVDVPGAGPGVAATSPRPTFERGDERGIVPRTPRKRAVDGPASPGFRDPLAGQPCTATLNIAKGSALEIPGRTMIGAYPSLRLGDFA
jgi:hypothetical protein